MRNTALVTGASSGIGAELARYHASKGGDVVLVARSEDKLNELKSELESAHGIKATVVAADLAQPDSAEKIFAATEAAGLQIDILINNAGFVKAGDLDGIELWDKAATPESVAKCGYDAMFKGDLIKINEMGLHFMLNWLVPFLPRKTVLKISQKAMEKK